MQTWTKGTGVFSYLRSLQSDNSGNRRDLIATVFRGTINRMRNGYLLRDVINKVNGNDHGSLWHSPYDLECRDRIGTAPAREVP